MPRYAINKESAFGWQNALNTSDLPQTHKDVEKMAPIVRPSLGAKSALKPCMYSQLRGQAKEGDYHSVENCFSVIAPA
jgi:hypothetical protein